MAPRKSSIKLFYRDIFDTDIVRYYKKNPEYFIRDIIFNKEDKASGGTLFITDQQQQIIDSVCHHKATTVRAGRGIGKTACLSWIILWWLCVNDFPKIVCTAPTFPQLKSVLWPEVAKWLRSSLVKDLFEHTAERLYLKEDPKNWWAEPRTSSKEEAMQGLHADNLLIIMDEASGVADNIYELIQGSLTQKNNKMVLISNPTRTSGFFYDSHHKYQNRWSRLAFNSEESPIVDKEFITDMEVKYGRNHPLFLVHVKGEFPSGDPDSFIPLGEVEAAVDRETMGSVPIELGVDVARKGDDLTVICWREGLYVHPLVTNKQTTIPQTTSLVLQTIKDIRRKTGYNGTISVKVDDTGVGGGVTDELNLDRDNGIEVVPCNFGGKGNDIYENEASEMWGNVKSNISMMHLPDDRALVEELAARRWEVSGRGKIWIEPKKKFKKDFKSSPDRADALVLCFASKTNESLVLKHFDPVKKTVIQDVTREYGMFSSGEKFCSVYYTKAMQVAILWTVWVGNKLVITDEYEGDASIVEATRMLVLRKPYQKVIGNGIMFDKKHEDLYMQYSQMGLFLSENYMFDEYGSISGLSRMIASDKVGISNRCSKIVKQMSEWKVGGSKKDMEEKYTLCYALLNIVAELKDRIDPPPMRDRVPYLESPEDFMMNNMIDDGNATSWLAV